jgi:hypothetical protein
MVRQGALTRSVNVLITKSLFRYGAPWCNLAGRLKLARISLEIRCSIHLSYTPAGIYSLHNSDGFGSSQMDGRFGNDPREAAPIGKGRWGMTVREPLGVIWQGMRVALVGAVVGIAAAFALTRLLASLLFAVKPWDPAVFISTLLVLCAVALLAVWLPAAHASRLDPMQALRTE